MSTFIHKVLHPFHHSSSSTPQVSTSMSTTTCTLPTTKPSFQSSTTSNTAISSPAPSTTTTTDTTLHSSTNPTPTTTTTTSIPLQPLPLLELFQSQGCSSCPPANAHLLSLFTPPSPASSNALLLTYEVTYWDHLGWTDTLGCPHWDARQRAYANAQRERSVYTPQVIVDGGATPVGNHGGWRDVRGVLAAAGKRGPGVRFELVEEGRGIRVRAEGGQGEGSGLGGRGREVLVVYYEVEPRPVKILRGENRGVTERYRNVVRDMEVLSTWEGGEEVVVQMPARRSGLEMAVLVQVGNGGHILGAARI